MTQNLEGAQVSSAVGYEIKEVRGDVRVEGEQVVLKLSGGSDLRLIESISTEVRAGTAAGIEGSRLPEHLGEVSQKLDGLLAYLKSKDKGGRSVSAVEDSSTQISRVDLLLKKAALLKIQAEQMMLDHAARNKKRVNLATGRIDLGNVFRDFDERGYKAKLGEAQDLLNEARLLDSTNTEVLLHLAELLTQLTPDDQSDEQRVLFEVQGLLRNPRDATERFRLAQATFLLATSHDPVDAQSLRDARGMFDLLGRTEWVRHCDDLLRSGEPSRPGEPRREPPVAGGGAPRSDAGVQSWPGVEQPTAGFVPFGRWNVRVMDAVGSVMTLDLRQDGTFHAAQQVGAYGGMSIEGNGQWVFNPASSWLQLQGMIGNFQPFALGIAVQGQQDNSFYGVGTDGIAYVLNRTPN
ncbi:MAG: hypothetical protein HYY34_01315 [Chloroflexi bacterium]|nr:hypothetical protein [Chloroflexota bacterium]